MPPRKRKLTEHIPSLNALPIQKEKALLAVVCESLDEFFFSTYHASIPFSAEDSDENIMVECDFARLIAMLHICIDSCGDVSSCTFRADDTEATLTLYAKKTDSLVPGDLYDLAMLGGIRFLTGDDRISFFLSTSREYVLHLFALSKQSLKQTIQNILDFFSAFA